MSKLLIFGNYFNSTCDASLKQQKQHKRLQYLRHDRTNTTHRRIVRCRFLRFSNGNFNLVNEFHGRAELKVNNDDANRHHPPSFVALISTQTE